MHVFFSCDWGTSTFRLRLIDAENANVLSVIRTDYGIASAFEKWKEVNPEEKDRLSFYLAYLSEQVNNLRHGSSGVPEHVPVILSGMASSSIGMLELPYKNLPFNCDGSDLIIKNTRDEDPRYDVIIVSGARTAIDVIRGEETILAGCNPDSKDVQQLFILPGTHSKHISVVNGMAENITTYMTGELFNLLTTKSILATSVKKNHSTASNGSRYFIEGVNKGISLNLMNSIFHVRTNQLFAKATGPDNYHYLSGLLIGHEVKDILKNNPGAIKLVCSEELKTPYLVALDVLQPGIDVDYQNADEALVKGHLKIMKQLGYFSNARLTT